MVLEHAPQNACLVVVYGPVAHAHLLSDGNLHVGHIAPVPHRLEDHVGKPREEDILRGLFAEVVVDAVNLVLAEGLVNFGIELGGRDRVIGEGLLDDDLSRSAALLGQSCLAEQPRAYNSAVLPATVDLEEIYLELLLLPKD